MSDLVAKEILIGVSGPVIPCVGAIVADGEGRLLMIKRGHEPGAGLWSIPGGRIEPGGPRQVSSAPLAFINNDGGGCPNGGQGGEVAGQRRFGGFGFDAGQDSGEGGGTIRQPLRMVPVWYHNVVAMNLRLDEEDSALLRALAEAEHVSLHEAALRAIRRSAREVAHTERVREATAEMMDRWGEVLDRLGRA